MMNKKMKCVVIKIEGGYGVKLPDGELETSLDGDMWISDKETATALAEILSDIFSQRLKKTLVNQDC